MLAGAHREAVTSGAELRIAASPRVRHFLALTRLAAARPDQARRCASRVLHPVGRPGGHVRGLTRHGREPGRSRPIAIARSCRIWGVVCMPTYALSGHCRLRTVPVLLIAAGQV